MPGRPSTASPIGGTATHPTVRRPSSPRARGRSSSISRPTSGHVSSRWSHPRTRDAGGPGRSRSAPRWPSRNSARISPPCGPRGPPVRAPRRCGRRPRRRSSCRRRSNAWRMTPLYRAGPRLRPASRGRSRRATTPSSWSDRSSPWAARSTAAPLLHRSTRLVSQPRSLSGNCAQHSLAGARPGHAE